MGERTILKKYDRQNSSANGTFPLNMFIVANDKHIFHCTLSGMLSIPQKNSAYVRVRVFVPILQFSENNGHIFSSPL